MTFFDYFDSGAYIVNEFTFAQNPSFSIPEFFDQQGVKPYLCVFDFENGHRVLSPVVLHHPVNMVYYFGYLSPDRKQFFISDASPTLEGLVAKVVEVKKYSVYTTYSENYALNPKFCYEVHDTFIPYEPVSAERLHFGHCFVTALVANPEVIPVMSKHKDGEVVILNQGTYFQKIFDCQNIVYVLPHF